MHLPVRDIRESELPELFQGPSVIIINLNRQMLMEKNLRQESDGKRRDMSRRDIKEREAALLPAAERYE
jgi:hypothetical protein